MEKLLIILYRIVTCRSLYPRVNILWHRLEANIDLYMEVSLYNYN